MSVAPSSSSSTPPAAVAGSSSAPAISVKLKKWMPIGIWKFGKNINESCPICQTPLTLRCIECQVNDTRQCGLSYGQCGHIFHACCIKGWVEKNVHSKAKCPYCFADWELVREEFNHC